MAGIEHARARLEQRLAAATLVARNSGRQSLNVYVIRFGVALVRFAFYAGLLRRSRTFGAISE